MSEKRTTTIINRQVIKDLLGDDESIIAEFEQLFVTQAKSAYRDIIQLHEQAKLSEVKSAAHSLKSSASAVGAEQFAQLLEELELHCENNNRLQCHISIRALSQALRLLIEEIEYGH